MCTHNFQYIYAYIHLHVNTRYVKCVLQEGKKGLTLKKKYKL